jgi:hypothetical protein
MATSIVADTGRIRLSSSDGATDNPLSAQALGIDGIDRVKMKSSWRSEGSLGIGIGGSLDVKPLVMAEAELNHQPRNQWPKEVIEGKDDSGDIRH